MLTCLGVKDAAKVAMIKCSVPDMAAIETKSYVARLHGQLGIPLRSVPARAERRPGQRSVPWPAL